ncbi:BQ2448_5288 [Microbotryum intermedium]|uniref:BQ2448_5288 protein n=1 Tax=Microbotryum intermedium TaxID=269621 RepID=A0A238F3R6_9BASI|nr:BQ2448_5288 [Microbotryum intermedium]
MSKAEEMPAPSIASSAHPSRASHDQPKQQTLTTSFSKNASTPSSRKMVALRPFHVVVFFVVWGTSLYLFSPQAVSAGAAVGRSSSSRGPSSRAIQLFAAMTCCFVEETYRVRVAERKAYQEKKHREIVHKTTQRVKGRLQRPRSIFQRVQGLKDAGAEVPTLGQQCVLGLCLFDLVSIRQMGTDLKYSELVNAQMLAQEANELGKLFRSRVGDESRALKDIILHIHSLDRKAFHSIPMYSEEIDSMLLQALGAETSKELSQLTASIDAKFEQFDVTSQALLSKVEEGFSLATRSTDRARMLYDQLKREEHRIKAERASSSLLRSVLETTALVLGDDLTFHARKLKRNSILTHQSANSVVTLSHGLEELRASLVTYKASVGSYKANVIGYHLASLGSSAKEEARHLGKKMQELKESVRELRQASRLVQVQNILRLLPF